MKFLSSNTRWLLPLLLFAPIVLAQKSNPCPEGSETMSTVYQAGERDDYRLPAEPASPGKDLLPFSQKWRQFDEQISGLSFGHTFTDLPCMIVGATLVLRVTPGERGFDDIIGLEGRVEDFAWSRTLSEIVEGWEPFRSYEITLDLLNLPLQKGTYNILNDILQDGSLDVYLGDDTAIDDMTLYITWCQFDDCNGNCVPDSEDIASGTSQDVNRNGIPDECEEPQNDPIQLLCERYILVSAGVNCCGQATLAPTVVGVVGDYIITNDYLPNQGGYVEDCFPMGVTHIRFTLTDLTTGQTTTCTVTVHVTDNTPPVITPKEN